MDSQGNDIALVGHQTTVDFQDNAWWGITLTDLYGWSSFNDYADYIDGHGMNFVRSWIVWHTRDSDGGPDSVLDTPASPMMYARSATPGANDGGNKFDLTSFDQTFFDTVRTRVSALNDRGIYISIMLFDVWTFHNIGGTNSRWDNNPWMVDNNTQGVDIDANADGLGLEFYFNYNNVVPNTGSQTILDMQKAYVEKMIDTLYDMPNVIWEVSNELRMDTWQNLISAHIQSYETANYPGQEHLVLISAGGVDTDASSNRRTNAENLAMDNDLTNFQPPDHDVDNPPVNNNTKPILIDTDHLNPNTGYDDAPKEQIWEHITRGFNFVYYDGQAFKLDTSIQGKHTTYRANLGLAATILNEKVNDLSAMAPSDSISSTGYCLCNSGNEYVIFSPGSGSFSVSGFNTAKRYTYEWYNTDTATLSSSGSLSPLNSSVTFTPPAAEAVLFVQEQEVTASGRPYPMVNNGLTHPWQVPVLFAADGDTLSAAYTGTANPITVPDPSGISCSGASGAGGGGYVIRDSGGITELEQSSLGYDLFWICPGDYRTAGGNGQIDLNDGGTAQTDAGMIKVICIQGGDTPLDMDKNPWQNTNGAWEIAGNPFDVNHDYTKECVLPPMQAGPTQTDAGYWFWQGVTWENITDYTSNKPIDVEENVWHIFDRVWVDCSNLNVQNTTVGNACIYPKVRADNFVMQNSAIGPMSPTYDYEMTGITTHHSADNIWISNNRFWNLGHWILLGGNYGSGTTEGNKIINNDFTTTAYLTALGSDVNEWYSRGVKCSSNSVYTGCSSNQATTWTDRIFDPLDPTFSPLFAYDDRTATVACGQNFISGKVGSANPANPAIIQYNRLWGHRPSTTHCSGDNGSTSAGGFGMSASYDAQNTQFLDNITFDMAGLAIATPNSTIANSDRDNVIFRQNVHEFSDVDVSATSTNLWAFDTYADCTSSCSGTGYTQDFTTEFNTVAAVPPNVSAAQWADDIFNRNDNRSYMTFNCNLAFESGSTGTNPGGTQNVVVNGTFYPSLTQTVELNNPDTSGWGDFTFYYDLQQASPPQYTISGIVPPSGVSFEDHCTVANPGIDIRGVTRAAATTPGAFVAGDVVPDNPPPAQTGVWPLEWNNTRTSVLRDRPVIWPTDQAAGIYCDPATYTDLDWDGSSTTGKYSCITDIPTTGHNIQASDSLATMEAEINDPANGNVFLIDIFGDWSADGILNITRTDTADGAPLWLLPSDIATRTEGPWKSPSAVLPSIRIRCDGAADPNGVDGVRIIGLEISAPGEIELLNSGWPGTCTDPNAADDLVVAWNYFHDWGVNNSGASNAVLLRGDNAVFVDNYISNGQNWFSAATSQRDMGGVAISSSDGPVYVGRNYIRGVSGDHISVASTGVSRRRYAIEHNTLEWGSESRMDGDGSSTVLPTLNTEGLYIGGENCIQVQSGSNGEPNLGGWIRGNVCLGQRLNNDWGGSNGDSDSAAIDVSWTTTEDIRIHGNFILDSHTKCFAEGTDGASLIDFTGNVCEINADGANAYAAGPQWGGIVPGFASSRVAFNTIACVNGPGVSGIVDSGQSNDVKYNVVIDCDSATANHIGTPCTGCLVENVLRNTASSTADSSAITDSDVEAYLDFGLYLDHPHFADANVTGNASPRIYTLRNVSPPVGGTAAAAVPSPTFTGGYGTVYPVHRYYNQVP